MTIPTPIDDRIQAVMDVLKILDSIPIDDQACEIADTVLGMSIDDWLHEIEVEWYRQQEAENASAA